VKSVRREKLNRIVVAQECDATKAQW